MPSGVTPKQANKQIPKHAFPRRLYCIVLLLAIPLLQMRSRQKELENKSNVIDWKAATLPSSTKLDDLCVSNQDSNFQQHHLYLHAAFLPQLSLRAESDVSTPAWQYQQAIEFLKKHNLHTIHIYGHRTSGRTHRWIHYAWLRTWLDIAEHSKDPLTVCWTDFVELEPLPSTWNWGNSLVVSTYGHEAMAPVVPSSIYIVHCMDGKKYQPFPTGNVIQWYRPVYEGAPITKNWQPGVYLDWATDLTPQEIEYNRPRKNGNEVIFGHQKEQGMLFCGTIWRVNRPEWTLMTQVAKAHKIVLHHYGKGKVDLWHRGAFNPYYVHHQGGYIGHRQQYQMYRLAYMTPSIQGSSHLESGYVPCRIFKTISAGQLGISNNRATLKLFDENSVVVRHGADYDNLNKLMALAEEVLNETDPFELAGRINRAMTTVQNQHTYLARFVQIFEAFGVTTSS